MDGFAAFLCFKGTALTFFGLFLGHNNLWWCRSTSWWVETLARWIHLFYKSDQQNSVVISFSFCSARLALLWQNKWMSALGDNKCGSEALILVITSGESWPKGQSTKSVFIVTTIHTSSAASADSAQSTDRLQIRFRRTKNTWGLCVCVCYLQLVLQLCHSVCMLAAPRLLPLPRALLQTRQHTLLTALQLPNTHTLLLTHTLQVGDLRNKTTVVSQQFKQRILFTSWFTH